MIDYRNLEKATIVQLVLPQNMERDHMLLVKRRLEEIQEVFEGYVTAKVEIF